MDALRISDADREAAVDLLGEQYAVGRLTKDEFDERSDAVWSARTQGDLAPVFADLPVRVVRPAGRAPARYRGGAHRPRWWPVPLAPVLFALVALTCSPTCRSCCSGCVLWFVLSRRHGVACPPGGHRHDGRGCAQGLAAARPPRP